MRSHRLSRLALLTQGVALIGLGTSSELGCGKSPDPIDVNSPAPDVRPEPSATPDAAPPASASASAPDAEALPPDVLTPHTIKRTTDHEPTGSTEAATVCVGGAAQASDPRVPGLHELAAAAALGMYELKRTSGEALSLTAEHDAVARPRKGEIHWDAFDRDAYAAEDLDAAAYLWKERAVQEMHSLALFTELASQLHLLGAPLDWSGAFARMIADEVRHTDLCLRMCEALGRPASPAIDPSQLHLLGDASPRAHVRHTVLAAFCIGETVSGHMFRCALKAANVPLAREVVSAIVVDETFHGELGWELGALLMRSDGSAFDAERAVLAAELPRLFRHYARLCCALRGPTWARREPAVASGANFGTMTDAGYGRAFFDAMEADVVPGLKAIGFPEAEPAFAGMLSDLDGGGKSQGKSGPRRT